MQKQSAFTLIELLVVIAIIAILAAILFPVFARAREQARGITCISNAKQIITGTLMYSQDYDEGCPLYFSGLHVTPGSRNPGYGTPYSPPSLYWPDLISPYVQKAATGGTTLDFTRLSKVFVCPSAPYNEAAVKANGYANLSSLGMSDNWAEWYCPADCNNGTGASHSFVEAVAPANTVLFGESMFKDNSQPGFSLILTPVDGGNSGSSYYGNCNTSGYGKYSLPRMFTNMSWRHTAQKQTWCSAPPGGPTDGSPRVNVAYADGHAKSQTIGTLSDFKQWSVTQGAGDVGCMKNPVDGQQGCWYP